MARVCDNPKRANALGCLSHTDASPRDGAAFSHLIFSLLFEQEKSLLYAALLLESSRSRA
jgi:hypothetical protein